ncbi:electron transfer flavoprotein subunit alpha/FixB family protein [Photobacterium sanguinicancri]|uniref:Electron transfer flavoprotein subunit alpha n=1 Tax=Photobacterium sanguinicancri TaxID=875932 RepID=A0AAW7Y5A1_9GAMM|nr:FAD-binding protein [Photobacterium sanguinicancri]MDO6541780.1 FAD-binding protein [Photobacterium sanguinicancri]
MKTLIIAEHNGHSLATDTLKVVRAAASLDQPIDMLIAGENVNAIIEQAQRIETIDSVLVADSSCYQHALAENVSVLVEVMVSEHSDSPAGYSHILTAATTFGKNLLPRIAALLDVGMLSDVIEIESKDTVIRPIYAGNALARVRSNDRIKAISVRASAFDAAEQLSDSQGSAPVNFVAITHQSLLVEFVSQQVVASARPELPAARVVVSGGRGLGSKENFAMVEQLADKLDAAIGASRAAVDAGYVSNELQVGQTGKIVAPDLYIAIGISGAIQHLAGMKDSKVIVAINNDPDAAIFEIADYALIGDLFEILPALIDELG